MTELHDEVQFVLVLKSVLKFDNARMFHNSKQLSFNHGLILFFLFMQFAFDDFLHGVGLSLFMDKKYVAIGSFADDAFNLEIFESDLLLLKQWGLHVLMPDYY